MFGWDFCFSHQPFTCSYQEPKTTDRHQSVRSLGINYLSFFLFYFFFLLLYHVTHFFHPWTSWGNCSSRQALAGPCSCDRSGKRKPHCLWHCEPHRLSASQTKLEIQLGNKHLHKQICSQTLEFCSQKDLERNWTGRCVFIMRGTVVDWFNSSTPSIREHSITTILQ